MTVSGTQYDTYDLCRADLASFDPGSPRRCLLYAGHEGGHSNEVPACGVMTPFGWMPIAPMEQHEASTLSIARAPCILSRGHEGRCNPDTAALVRPEGWRDVASAALVESRDAYAFHLFVENTPIHLVAHWLGQHPKVHGHVRAQISGKYESHIERQTQQLVAQDTKLNRIQTVLNGPSPGFGGSLVLDSIRRIMNGEDPTPAIVSCATCNATGTDQQGGDCVACDGRGGFEEPVPGATPPVTWWVAPLPDGCLCSVSEPQPMFGINDRRRRVLRQTPVGDGCPIHPISDWIDVTPPDLSA